ncbi:MAG: MATE family efflux transporter [Desulfurococcaceae archaeon]
MEVIGKYRDMVINEPVGKTLLRLGLPLMVFQLVNISYNLVDTYWLSQYSDIAYAAPRQVWPFFMFINSIAQGLAAANTALISQAVGAQDYSYTKRVVSQFVSATLIFNGLITFIFLLSGPFIYKYLVATPMEIYDSVVTYSTIISIDLLLSGLTIGYGTIFQALGDTKTPSRFGIISSILNVLLDPIMIFGVKIGNTVIFPDLGIAGAAWATVLSRFIGLVLVFKVLSQKYMFLRTKLTLQIDIEWLMKSLKIGLPVTLMHMSNSLAFMLQNRLINLFGVYVVAAAVIGFILMDLADAALWGFTFSVSTMIGQAIGANLEKRAREVAIKSMVYIGIMTSLGSLFVLIFRQTFINVFTSIPTIVNEADLFVKLFSPTLSFFAIFFIGMSIGRGSGHTLYPTVVGIIRLWIFRLGFGYLLSVLLGTGTIGLWISMSLSNLFSGLAVIPWALWGKWTIPVINKSEDRQG